VLGGLAALLAGALAIAGVFSSWIALDPGSGSEAVTGWSLTTGDGLLKSNDPYLIVALGAVTLLLAIVLFVGVARLAARLAVMASGIAIMAVAALNWASIASYVTDNFPSSFEVTTELGFYLAIAGGALAIVAGLAPARR
jgi:hypothetical protein